MDTYMLVGLAWVVVIVVGDWLAARWLRDDEQDGEARAKRASPTRGPRTQAGSRTDQTIRPRTGAAGESACDAESRVDVALQRAVAGTCESGSVGSVGSGGAAGSASPPAAPGDGPIETRP
jgi:hypothetical protein